MSLLKKYLLLIVLSGFSLSPQATTIQLETNFGNIDINLYDNGTPNTVANFLTYINSGAYSQSIVHRAVPGFIIQGGGFSYTGTWPATAIAASPSVVNEPVYSNVRGTIAMAKIGGQPDSATNQWFINLADNSANLDGQNGGFTVFGQVTAGMEFVDQISSLTQYNKGGAFASLPMQNYDGTSTPDATNLVIINSVLIIDATVDTASALVKPLNRTSVDAPTSSSGGGSMGLLLLPLFLLLGFRRKYKVLGSRLEASY
ncbi:MAG: peptidylprolyl isomerase [Enterobacterales bacterium]|nr:peptidylprolyl isomerase [Enterobacterales bacterium]